jgi:hypothetical protein
VLILLGFDFGGSDLAELIGAFLRRDQQIAQGCVSFLCAHFFGCRLPWNAIGRVI